MDHARRRRLRAGAGATRHAECDQFRRNRAVSERVELRSTAAAAAQSRDWLASHVPTISPQALLLATELVTNAVRHAGRGCDTLAVTLDWSPKRMRIAVSDDGRGFEWHPSRSSLPTDEGGYGLVLVDQLASRWAIDNAANRTTVWFELALAGDAQVA